MSEELHPSSCMCAWCQDFRRNTPPSANDRKEVGTHGQWECPNHTRFAIYGLAIGIAPLSDLSEELVSVVTKEIAAEVISVLAAVHNIQSPTPSVSASVEEIARPLADKICDWLGECNEANRLSVTGFITAAFAAQQPEVNVIVEEITEQFCREIESFSTLDGLQWATDRNKVKEFITAVIAPLQAENKELSQAISDQNEVIEDKRRLTAEIGRILDGENAAKQPSLCDLVGPIRILQSDLTKAREELAQAKEMQPLACATIDRLAKENEQLQSHLATAQESARQCRIAAGVTVKELEQRLATAEADALELWEAIDSAARAKEGQA